MWKKSFFYKLKPNYFFFPKFIIWVEYDFPQVLSIFDDLELRFDWDKVEKIVPDRLPLTVFIERRPIELYRWILMQNELRNIFGSGRKKKFLCWNIKKSHLLKKFFFLCILHGLLLLGTFFSWLLLLGTVPLIATGRSLFLR